MKIIEKSISDLIQAEYNPRKLSDEERSHLKDSLQRFGMVDPVIVNVHKDRKNILIGGHQRTKVWASMGNETIPCVELSLTRDQERELNVRLNKNTGSWDIDALMKEFDHKELADFGWSEEELSDIEAELETLSAGDDEEIEEDDFDGEPPEDPITELGRMYQLGKHRLMCGDSTCEKTVARLMGGEKADMVFTDPPYGVEYQSNMRTKSERFDILKNDDAFLDITPILKKFSIGWVFIWTSWKVQHKWIEIFSSFDYPTNMIVWHKPGGGIGDLKKTFSSDYEVALVWHRGAELCGKRIGSVWTINKDAAIKYIHPTQKPVALGVEAIDKTTKKENIVLDLFGGSGSTLIACEQTDRQCRMMELDPKYCDVIVKRYCKLTDQDPEKVFETGVAE